MKRPIAATASVVYFLLVVAFSFYMLEQDIPPVTSLLLTSFTSVYGVIIAFYFGGAAYVEREKFRQRHNPASSEKV